jgi:excisionase family DNA binding protein
MPKRHARKAHRAPARRERPPDILDVHKAAALLTVSADTVYDLFKKGELTARKVGRKWITTRAALMRWIESSFAANAAERAVADDDNAVLVRALKSGKVRVKGGAH